MKEKKYHHGDLKNILIRNGTRLLSEGGIDNLSLRKVAKMSDVSHTAPYRHFKNKDDLLLAIVNGGLKVFYNSLYRAVEKFPDDPFKQLEAMGKEYILFSISHSDFMRLLFFNSSTKQEIFSKVERIDSYGLLKNCVSRCIETGIIKTKSVDSASLILWGAVHGLSCLIIEKNINFEGASENFVDAIVKEIMTMISA